MSSNRNVGKVAVRFKGNKFNATEYTFRYSNIGLVLSLGDDTGSHYYEPYIHEAIVLNDEFGKDHSAVSINLANDGSLDDLIEYNFNGYDIEVYLSSNEAPNEHKYYLMYTGSIDTLIVNEKKVSIKCLSHFEIFNVLMNPATFEGSTGTYEGGDELIGVHKPRVIGKVFNIRPKVIKAADHVYGCNWDTSGNFESVSSIDAVRDGGAALTFSTNFASTAAMTAPSAGFYNTCTADGTIRVGTDSHYDITMDVTDNTTDTYTEWLDLLVTELSLAGKSVTSVQSYTIGAYFESATTYTQADKILGENLDLYLWFTADGKINVAKIRDDSAETPSVHFVEAGQNLDSPDDMVYFSSNRDKYELPYKEVTLNYKKNYFVQTRREADIAGGLSLSAALPYEQEYAKEVETNVCTTDPYLLDNEIELNSAIFSSTDAATEVTAWKDERKYLTDYITVSCPLLAYNSDIISGVVTEATGTNINVADNKLNVPNGVSDHKDDVIYGVSDANSAYNPQVSLSNGLIATMKHSRFDYSNHRFIIYGIKINTRKMLIEYKLKGYRKDSECTYT